MVLNEFLTINSVKCGKVIIPFASLNSHLCQFVRSIVVEQNDPRWAGYIGRSGSSTLVRIFGTNYICLAKHELGIEQGLDKVRISTGSDDKLDNITFDSVISPAGRWSEDEEFSDIMLLHAHEQSPENNPNYVYFFPVNVFDRQKIFASLIVACPFYDNNFDVDNETGETKCFHETTVVRDCYWEQNYKTNAKYVESFTYNANAGFPENGMSGGAVFSIVETGQGLEVYLHGIIVRASSGKLKVVNSNFLLNLQDDFIHDSKYFRTN